MNWNKLGGVLAALLGFVLALDVVRAERQHDQLEQVLTETMASYRQLGPTAFRDRLVEAYGELDVDLDAGQIEIREVTDDAEVSVELRYRVDERLLIFDVERTRRLRERRSLIDW